MLENYVAQLVTWPKERQAEERTLKDESRTALEEALQALMSYVNTTAKGRLSVLLSSGFPVFNPATAIPLPHPVEWLSANNTRQSGQIRLDFQAQKFVNHDEYSYRKTIKPEEYWSDHISTTSSRDNIIVDLEAGKYYQLHARAVNRQGAGDWSQPVKLLVR